MTILLTIFYFLLFLGGLVNNRIFAIALPIFTFVFPKQLTTLAFGDANLSTIFLLICGVKLLFVNYRKYTQCQMAWTKVVLLYFGIVYIGTQIWSLFFIDYSEYINTFKSIIDGLLCMFALLTMINIIIDQNRREYLLIGLIVTVLLESIVAIGLLNNFDTFSMFYSGLEFNSIDEYFRATGTFNGPWALGGFLGISIVLLLFIFGSSKINKIGRVLIMACALTALYVLILTESRAGWLLLSISLLILMLRGSRVVMKGIVVSVVLGIIAVNYFLDWETISLLITHRVEYTYNNSVTGGVDASTMTRFYIWEKVLNNYNPLYLFTGYGIRNAYNVFGSTTHNTYLSLFIYSGLIGCAIIFKMILYARRLSTKSTKNVKKFLTAIFIGICAYGLSADLLYDIRVFTFALCTFSILLISDNNIKGVKE